MLGNGTMARHSASPGISTCLNLEGSKAYFPFLFNSNDIAATSLWVSYEIDAEIEDLIGWLSDNSRLEIE